MGPNSNLVRAESKPKGGELAKGDGPLGSSKSQSSIPLVKGQDCGPKGSNLSPFKGLEVDYRSRPKQGLEAGNERPVVGVFAFGPRAVCLGLLMEEVKANLSPSSSSLQESGETEDEEAEERDDIENIPTTTFSHSGSKFECKEIEKIEGDSLSKRYEPLVSHYTPLPLFWIEILQWRVFLVRGFFLRVVVIVRTRRIPYRSILLKLWNLETLWKREGWKKSSYC